jgi:hypothetical protein
MDFKTFLEYGTKGEGPNASGGRGGAYSMKPGLPQKGSLNPEPGKKELKQFKAQTVKQQIPGGPFGGGGPRKTTEIAPSPLSPRGRNTQKWQRTPGSPLCPHGLGDTPGPPQPIPPSKFVSQYMKWSPPANAAKQGGWPVRTEKSSNKLF